MCKHKWKNLLMFHLSWCMFELDHFFISSVAMQTMKIYIFQFYSNIMLNICSFICKKENQFHFEY